ncbi:MAG: ExbD/TolR family protein [bacterium]
MRTGRKRNPPQIMMAPLIDVVFQLLAFFLVTWHYVKLPSLQVNLPESSTATVEQMHEFIVVVIQKDGTFLWENKKVDGQMLERFLRERIARGSEKPKVQIFADRFAPVQSVILVLDILRILNLTEISLVALPQNTRQ